MRHSAIALLTGLVVVTASSLLWAQPKPGYSPTSTHIFPAGAQRGTTVPVRVGTECAPPRTEFQIRGVGVTGNSLLETELADSGEHSAHRKPTIIPITYPREWASEIRIADDAKFGVVYWRLHSAQGGTASRPFIVGDLPEFIEAESNSTFDLAERVEFPVTLNGQISGERDADHYRLSLKARQIVSFEVIAGRIGSPLDPVVDLLDIDGRPLEVQRVYIGSDPVLVFMADKDRDVVLRIANVNHRGDPSFVYRVDVRSGPWYRSAIPGGFNRGEPAHIDLLALTGDGRSLTEKVGMLHEPAGPSDSFLIWQNRIRDENTFRFSIDSHPVATEREPNAESDQTTPLQIPSTTYGRFATATDLDAFTLNCSKGERLWIECRAWPPGTPAIPTARIIGNDGKTLSSGNAASTEDGTLRMTWTTPTDGLFTLSLADLRFGSQGGNDFVYRLVVESDEPDFSLEIDTDSLTATQGQTATLTVNARRHGGLNDAIVLTFDGLPAGVEVEDAVIPEGKSAAKVKFTIDESARVESHRLRVTGRVADREITRTAQCRHLGVDSEGVSIGETTLPRLFLSIQHKPLFRLECAEAYLYAHRGSVFMYPMEVERLEGFDGTIQLQRGDRQNRDMDGVEIWNATLKPGNSAIEVPIYLPESMAINVQSQTQLYSQAWASFTDQHGKEQTVLVLSEKRNMLRTLPPVVKLKADRSQIAVEDNTTVECPLIVDRTSNFPGAMRVELLDPPDGVSAETFEIAAGATRGTASVRITGPVAEPVTVTFRGTGTLDDGTVIISESAVELVPAQ